MNTDGWEMVLSVFICVHLWLMILFLLVSRSGGLGMGSVSAGSWFFIGLDLGQRRDPSAQAVVERYGIPIEGRDPVTYEPRFVRQYRVRRLERAALGTAYPDVVERVRRLTQSE